MGDPRLSKSLEYSLDEKASICNVSCYTMYKSLWYPSLKPFFYVIKVIDIGFFSCNCSDKCKILQSIRAVYNMRASEPWQLVMQVRYDSLKTIHKNQKQLSGNTERIN